jgi:MFS family permease
LTIGVCLIAGLAPVAWLIVRRPEDAGSGPGTGAKGPSSRFDDGYEWSSAVATPAFWVFAIGAALYGLVASGIGLFNESILAERGFDANVYYQTLVVTALTALAGNFAGGWLATRVRLTSLLAASQFVLALGLIALPQVTTTLQVMLWAAAMGVGGGFVMVLFFSVWARVFGRRHLGRIQGIAQAVTVLASAVGPLVLAQCVAVTGSYAATFRILAVVIAAVGASALVVALPKPMASPARA